MADRMEQLDKVWILLDSSQQDSKKSLSVETPAGFCLTGGNQSARKRLDSVCVGRHYLFYSLLILSQFMVLRKFAWMERGGSVASS